MEGAEGGPIINLLRKLRGTAKVGRWRLAKIMRVVLSVFYSDVLVFFKFVLVPINTLSAILRPSPKCFFKK